MIHRQAASFKKLKELISARHCCKCCVVIVRRAGLPCMLHGWHINTRSYHFGCPWLPALFYAMHRCGFLPSATDENLHTKLPRRLAHSGPVRGGFDIVQDLSNKPLRLPGAQGQFYYQEHTVTQPTSFIPGHSYRLSADDSNCLSGASHDDSTPRGFLQGRYRPSVQSFPEKASSSVL